MLVLCHVSNVREGRCSDQLELLITVNDLYAMLKVAGRGRLAHTSHVAVHRCGQLFSSGGACASLVELAACIEWKVEFKKA
jgi:hypothetical protein